MKKSWSGQFKRSTKERRTDEASGITFASLAEKKRYHILKQLERVGQIQNLRCHVPFLLQSFDGKITVKTPTGRTAKYTADFVYLIGNAEIIEDVKGFSDKLSALRIAVFEALHDKKVIIVKQK